MLRSFARRFENSVLSRDATKAIAILLTLAVPFAFMPVALADGKEDRDVQLHRWVELKEVATRKETLGSFESAEKYFGYALKYAEKLGKKSNEYLETLVKITNLRLLQKKYAEAEEVYKSVEHLFQEKNRDGTIDREVIVWIEELADTYASVRLDDDQERLHFLFHSLKLRELISGDQHPNLIDVLRKIAAVYLRARQYHLAEPYLVRIVRIDQKKLGHSHFLVALELSQLGLCKCNVNKLDEAESYQRQSLSILESIARRDEEMITARGSIRTQLAETLLKARRLKMAEREARNALKILERDLGPDRVETVGTRQILSRILEKRGRLDEAAICIERNVEILETRFGKKNGPELIPYLKALRIVYRKQGKAGLVKTVGDRIKRLTDS